MEIAVANLDHQTSGVIVFLAQPAANLLDELPKNPFQLLDVFQRLIERCLITDGMLVMALPMIGIAEIEIV